MNGAPAKPISGVVGPQRRADRADRLDRRSRAAAASASRRTRSTSAGRADRVVDDRPFALGEFEVEAQRLEDQQDVGEEDRGVDAQPLGGGDGDLGGQVGVLAELEERDLRPDLAVFGHVPARLPHQPDRRDVGRLAAAGLEEGTVAARVGQVGLGIVGVGWRHGSLRGRGVGTVAAAGSPQDVQLGMGASQPSHPSAADLGADQRELAELAEPLQVRQAAIADAGRAHGRLSRRG